MNKSENYLNTSWDIIKDDIHNIYDTDLYFREFINKIIKNEDDSVIGSKKYKIIFYEKNIINVYNMNRNRRYNIKTKDEWLYRRFNYIFNTEIQSVYPYSVIIDPIQYTITVDGITVCFTEEKIKSICKILDYTYQEDWRCKKDNVLE